MTPSLESCAAIEYAAERYACYDKLAGRSPADTTKESGTESGAVVPAAPRTDAVVPAAPAAPAAPVATPAVPAVEPKTDAEAIFGLEQEPKKDRPDEIKLKWTRKQEDTHGKWIIAMENGQVWRQTDTRRFVFGNSEHWVIISRGFAGGFFLAEPGSHLRIRVKRIK